MKVWIDQDLCTGEAQCVEICPDVFFMHEDGRGYRSYVKAADRPGRGPDGQPELKMGTGLANVPLSLRDDVVSAAKYCPGECIFIEEPG
jgi:ferredoxin